MSERSDQRQLSNVSDPMSRREAHRRVFAAFFDEAKSPTYALSLRLLMAGMVVSLTYTATLASFGEGPRSAWVALLAPLTRAVAIVIPSVRWVGESLVLRGFPERAAYVSNVVAVQWLITTVFSVSAGALLIPLRTNIQRGFAAARTVQLGSRINFVPQAFLVFLLGITFGSYSLLHSASQDTGRSAFDLAIGSKGLLIPFWLMIAGWWGFAYYVWHHVLAKITIEAIRRAVFGRPKAEYVALGLLAPLAAVILVLFFSTMSARH